MPENLTAYISVFVTVIWFIGILIWLFRRKYGCTKTVYSGTGKAYRYYVTFQMNSKRRSFAVSEFSYNGYRIYEKGTLKYKGDRLIDFR